MTHTGFALEVTNFACPSLSLSMTGLCNFHMFTAALLVRWVQKPYSIAGGAVTAPISESGQTRVQGW